MGTISSFFLGAITLPIVVYVIVICDNLYAKWHDKHYFYMRCPTCGSYVSRKDGFSGNH